MQAYACSPRMWESVTKASSQAQSRHVASARPARARYLDHVSKNREGEREVWIEVEGEGI